MNHSICAFKFIFANKLKRKYFYLKYLKKFNLTPIKPFARKTSRLERSNTKVKKVEEQ